MPEVQPMNVIAHVLGLQVTLDDHLDYTFTTLLRLRLGVFEGFCCVSGIL